jgi:hypothetical protein
MSGRRVAGLILVAGLLVVGGRGVAGHQIGHYPSYYPDEIRIDAIDPITAGKGLAGDTLHAYVGAVPEFAGSMPRHAKAVSSLGSFLVIAFDTGSARFASPGDRCAAARNILAALSEVKSVGFVFHPYPLTPFHADYLHHVDRVEAAKAALAGAGSAPSAKIAAKGKLAEAVVEARWGPGEAAREIVLQEVAVDDLLADAGVQLVGWSGPPWIREGWFHAHRLLAAGLDPAEREAVEREYEPLVRGHVRSFAEHVETERRLLAALTGGCRRVVAGYGLRAEYVNDVYPEGIENVAYDALGGLNGPIFIRTVKLKDYPWNGKLHLGMPDRSQAAWNPVAGFSDRTGRLVWAAVGDPAMIPFPDNASWMPNRVQSEVARTAPGRSGGLTVPADALAPQPASGALQRVGDRAVASAKVTYDVIASPFEDGTEMGAADLYYPFAFTYRWGADPKAATWDPRLAPVFAALQERLVGLKLLRVDKTKHAVAEGLTVVLQTPVVEVYLRDAPGDERQVAALAPPWSTVPWHLLALMEEAVARGYAAFSQEEAARRQVPWLDLVRDERLRGRLVDLIAELEGKSYRPAALADIVTPEEAQARWRALRAFAEKNGHLLVTNGPYRLKQWTPESVVLEAVRDLTYPLGFGTFDRFVNPPRAVIGEAVQEGGRITVRADAEMLLKAGRGYHLTREPLRRTTTRGVNSLLVVSRYILLGPDGRVLAVDKMHWEEEGQFTIALPDSLSPGQYTAIVGIFLDGNALQPSSKVLKFRVGATGTRG